MNNIEMERPKGLKEGAQVFYLVYMGVGGDHKKRTYRHMRITPEEAASGILQKDNPDALADAIFSVPLVKHARPGAIVAVWGFDTNGNLQTYTLTAKRLGSIANRRITTIWQTASTAVEGTIAEAKKERADAGRNYIEEALQPIVVAYARASWQERNYIIANVVRIITTGRGAR